MPRDDDGRNVKRKRSYSPLDASAIISGPSGSNTGNHNSLGAGDPARGSGAARGGSPVPEYYSKARIGKPAPDFANVPAVVNGTFREISLKTYLGKYVVLVFYPQDFTFVCPTEITAFSDKLPQFKELATEILAISVDSKYSHLAWMNTPRDKGGVGAVKIPLLSDVTHQMSKDYGVFDDDLGYNIRGLFIIDAKGILRHGTLNDVSIGRSVEETFRILQALQFTSEYGDVCPADWQPGGPSIIPSPDESKEYFKLNSK